MSEEHKLKSYLLKMPDAALQNALGSTIVKALANYEFIKRKSDLVDCLVDFQGAGLFKNKDLLASLSDTFTDQDLNEIHQLWGAQRSLSAGEVQKKLRDLSFGKNKLSRALLAFFDLPEEKYIQTNTYVVSSDMEEINPRLSVSEMAQNPLEKDYKIFPLHDYQKGVKDKVIAEILESGTRLCVHMPTGSGKTKTSIEALVDFWRVMGRGDGYIVWLAHTRELCEQAYDTFKTVWKARGDTAISMARLFGGAETDLSDMEHGIVFAGFQKLSRNINAISKHGPTTLAAKNAICLRDHARIVVVDEAHKALAPDYKKSIDFMADAPDTRLMGLTATPGRSSDRAGDSGYYENRNFAYYFNDNFVGLNYDKSAYPSPISELQDKKYLAKVNRVEVQTNIEFTAEELNKISDEVDLPAEILERLSIDDQRNLEIVSQVKKAVVQRNEPTLIFATSKDHTFILKYLIERDENTHIRAECILGDTPSGDRARFIQEFKSNELMVLINYNVLTTGFDAPNLGTLIIARPTSSVILYSQMLGRALRGKRMGGTNETNTVVDIVDNEGQFGGADAAYNYFLDYFEQ